MKEDQGCHTIIQESRPDPIYPKSDINELSDRVGKYEGKR